MDAPEFLKYVLDPDRLAVVGLVAARPRTAAELAADTGQRERDVLAALAPLLSEGIVVQEGTSYALVRESLREVAKNLPQPAPPDQRVMSGMTEDEQDVLRRFFRGEQLIDIPDARAKRLVVLERIALDFEPGTRFPEREVNRVLQAYHPDYAALRRYLVDEGFLDREAGEYWRSGGRVA